MFDTSNNCLYYLKVLSFLNSAVISDHRLSVTFILCIKVFIIMYYIYDETIQWMPDRSHVIKV